MNHLSHLFLSGDDPDILVGNFITDFLKPSEQRSMPVPLMKGIRLHLFIDHTIDSNPIFKQTIQLIKTKQDRYAPVVADIYYDFLLVHHWNEFSKKDFTSFKQDIYSILVDRMKDPITVLIQERVKRMVHRDFLSSYTSFDYIPATFGFLKRRAKFENKFDHALEDFQDLFPQLNEQFSEVLPMMIKSVKEFGIILQNSRLS
jgi:acyl carrier protein phosphodiesterase